MRRTTTGAVLLGLTLSLTACPTAPAPLPPGAFADTLGGDTTSDQDTASECTPTCAGELAAEGWASAHGWELDGVTRQDGTFVLDGAGMPRAILRGAPWSGGFEAELTLEVTASGDSNSKLAFGAFADDPSSQEHETVAAVVSLEGGVEVEASVTRQTGTDESGAATFGTTSTDAVAVADGGEITLTLTATCTGLSIAVAGGDSAARELSASIPDVDTLFLQLSGDATVTVTSVRLTNPACTPDSPSPCSSTTCTSVDEPCEARDCTPLGACAQVPRLEGATCTPSDTSCYAEEGTCSADGVCEATPIDCDDQDPCTLDSCSGGCQHVPLEASDGGLDTSALNDAGLPTTTGADDAETGLVFGGGASAELANPGTGDGALAIAAWVRPTAWPTAGERADIASQALAAGGSWFCGLDDAGHLQLGAGSALAASTLSVPLDRWTHVACSYDAADDALRVFIDGVEAGSADAAGQFAASTSASSKLRFGSSTHPFTGVLDAVRVRVAAIATSATCAGAGCEISLCAADVGCFATPRGDSGCDDANTCTNDTCSDGTGCVHQARDDDTSCDDGDLCTENDVCVGGVCAPDADRCVPPSMCWIGSCEDTGCHFAKKECVETACYTSACDELTGDCVSTYEANCFLDLAGWGGRLELALLEPEPTVPGAMGPPAANGGTSEVSSWAREGEPVEVSLWPGLPDDAVLGYFRMEEVVTVTAGANELVGVPNERDTNRVLGGDSAGPAPAPVVSEEAGRFGLGLAPGGPLGTQLEGLATADGVTVMAWVAFGTPPSEDDVLATTVGTAPSSVTRSIRLGVNASGDWIVTAGGTELTFPRENGWHHVALTYDKTTSRLAAYHDGALVGADSATAEIGGGLVFGGTQVPPSAPACDDLVILGRAASASEIASVASVDREAFSSPFPDGVTVQADYDDVMVVRADPVDGPETVAHEVVGRHPHSDSGGGVAGVLGYWRFDAGSLAAAWFDGTEAVSSASLTVVDGAFGDASGAIIPSSASAALDKPWTDAAPFTVELWLRTEVSGTCAATTDGAVVLQTVNGSDATGAGWALRVCDGVARFDHVDADQAHQVTGLRIVNDGAWHHVLVAYDGDVYRLAVDGVLDGVADYTGDGALDGSLNAATLLYALDAGLGAGPVTASTAVDEVLFHDRARSLGYAYGRVYPTTPALRFLARTSEVEGQHVLPHYAVYVGDAAATGTAPGEGCDTLLECAGWVAWWPFDQTFDEAALTPDVAGGHHLDLDGASLSAEGLAASALVCDGARDLTAGALPELSRWNVEAGVYGTGSGVEALVAGAGSGGAAYRLGLTGTGQVAHGFGAEEVTLSGVLSNSWNFLGGSYEDDPATLTVYNAVTGGEQSATPTAAPPTATGELHVCADSDGGAGFTGSIDGLRVVDHPVTEAERLKYPALTCEVLASYATP